MAIAPNLVRIHVTSGLDKTGIPGVLCAATELALGGAVAPLRQISQSLARKHDSTEGVVKIVVRRRQVASGRPPLDSLPSACWPLGPTSSGPQPEERSSSADCPQPRRPRRRRGSSLVEHHSATFTRTNPRRSKAANASSTNTSSATAASRSGPMTPKREWGRDGGPRAPNRRDAFLQVPAMASHLGAPFGSYEQTLREQGGACMSTLGVACGVRNPHSS